MSEYIDLGTVAIAAPAYRPVAWWAVTTATDPVKVIEYGQSDDPAHFDAVVTPAARTKGYIATRFQSKSELEAFGEKYGKALSKNTHWMTPPVGSKLVAAQADLATGGGTGDGGLKIAIVAALAVGAFLVYKSRRG